MISVTINGEPRSLNLNTTLRALIAELELDEEAVAVERNREIVGRGDWGEVTLKARDTLEIVHFVGGG